MCLLQKNNITFKKLSENDLILLYHWFQIPHILKWYARNTTFTIADIKNKYLPRIDDATIPNYIIYNNDKPIGYIQYYQLPYHLPEGIKHNNHPIFNEFKPEELVGVDLFIADINVLHTGLSSDALNLFIKKYMIDQYKGILVDPTRTNMIAIKFFEKNGFVRIDSQDEQHVLLLKKLVNRL